MQNESDQAELFLNGQCVGTVSAKGSDTAWGYGDFTPNASFATFAALFGSWSLLMHADDGEAVQSDAAADELRAAEMAIDALRVELRWMQSGKVVHVAQLNIDGDLIEWRRGF